MIQNALTYNKHKLYLTVVINRNKNDGFTLIELVIVIVVIAILAAITIVAYNGVSAKARIAVVQNDLSSAGEQLEQYKTATSTSEQYPPDLNTANLNASGGTTFQYTYNSGANTYCLTATNSGYTYSITATNKTPAIGGCPGTETAPLASGGSIAFSGYNAVEPSTCPTSGGSWIKVPGNSLYNKPNGFCVQQYPAVNVSGVATSQNTGNKWTAITQPAAATAAAAIDGSTTHLITEDEWMAIATNAAAQPANWSGGTVGNGTLSTGSATSTHGGTSFVLSNGQTIYFDTGNTSYYAAYEWTCYTGPSAQSCGLAAKDQPTPANAYYTDQFGTFTSYGALTTASGYYYGDPRYANSALGAYVNSSRNTGLGYLRSSYSSGSSTVYAFYRGAWTGANSSGLFTMYINTLQSYAHAQYGFRAAS